MKKPKIQELLEQINIKITTGQEFKTGRIISGKEEYGKRIDFGALPNNTSKTVSHGINFSKSSFISMQCDFQETNYKISFQNYGIKPQTTNEPIIAFVGNTVIGIKTVSDMSAYTGFVTIYYIKTWSIRRNEDEKRKSLEAVYTHTHR